MLTAFHQNDIVVRGTQAQVVAFLREWPMPDRASDLLVFEDASGRQIDLDLRPAPATGRGRPPLGVTSREVTLLPRHWDWLAAQRGGTSAALRQLVEEASIAAPNPRQGQDAAFRFLTAIAGDMPKFEDAVRDIYLGNAAGYDQHTQDWPPAIRAHGRALAFP